MRIKFIAVLSILGLTSGLLAGSLLGQGARRYYDELYKANALDHQAYQYVCFDEDQSLDTFFIFADSNIYKQQFIESGQLKSLPLKERRALEKGFIVVRGYKKGVAVGDVDFYDKDGDSWVRPFEINHTPMQMRLNVTPGTLRYKRSVEILHPDKSLKQTVDRFGRCELLPPPSH